MRECVRFETSGCQVKLLWVGRGMPCQPGFGRHNPRAASGEVVRDDSDFWKGVRRVGGRLRSRIPWGRVSYCSASAKLALLYSL